MVETIIVGIDGSPLTSALVDISADFARIHQAKLVLLCAVDPGYDLPEPDGQTPRMEDEVEYPAAAIEREGVDRLIRKLVGDLQAGGAEVSYDIESGDPVACLLAAAKRLPAPLMVLGHRHFSWFSRLTERSVALALLEEAECPVLVIPNAAVKR